MLVVMHHRDITCLDKIFLDLETFRSLDILKIDASECRSYGTHNIDKACRIGFIHFYIISIYAGEYFEQKSLAFHNRFGRMRAYVAKAENSRTVAYNGDRIATVGVKILIVGIIGNFKAWICHTRRIRQR